jgi:hypothetical protein
VIQAIESHQTPVFFFRYAENVAFRNCKAGWSGIIPDSFTHALEAEHVECLKITNFQGKPAHRQRDEAIFIH